MNVCSKFDSGKFMSDTKGIMATPCTDAGIQHNMGNKWALQAWKDITTSSKLGKI